MNTNTRWAALTATIVLMGGLALSPISANASRGYYYKPCSAIALELGNKITRLKLMAAERRAQGDNYGDRRLRSMANVINAHRGNLPCVNSQMCMLQ